MNRREQSTCTGRYVCSNYICFIDQLISEQITRKILKHIIHLICPTAVYTTSTSLRLAVLSANRSCSLALRRSILARRFSCLASRRRRLSSMRHFRVKHGSAGSSSSSDVFVSHWPHSKQTSSAKNPSARCLSQKKLRIRPVTYLLQSP